MLIYDPKDNLSLPEGHYTFEVREEPEKRSAESASGNEYEYYIFKFNASAPRSTLKITF